MTTGRCHGRLASGGRPTGYSARAPGTAVRGTAPAYSTALLPPVPLCHAYYTRPAAGSTQWWARARSPGRKPCKAHRRLCLCYLCNARTQYKNSHLPKQYSSVMSCSIRRHPRPRCCTHGPPRAAACTVSRCSAAPARIKRSGGCLGNQPPSTGQHALMPELETGPPKQELLGMASALVARAARVAGAPAPADRPRLPKCGRWPRTPRAAGLQMKVREREGAAGAATDGHCGAGQRLQTASWPAPPCGRPIAGHDAPLLGPLMPGPIRVVQPCQLAASGKASSSLKQSGARWRQMAAAQGGSETGLPLHGSEAPRLCGCMHGRGQLPRHELLQQRRQARVACADTAHPRSVQLSLFRGPRFMALQPERCAVTPAVHAPRTVRHARTSCSRMSPL